MFLWLDEILSLNILRFQIYFGDVLWYMWHGNLEILFSCWWDVMILFYCDVLKNYLCMFGLKEEVAYKSFVWLNYLCDLSLYGFMVLQIDSEIKYKKHHQSYICTWEDVIHSSLLLICLWYHSYLSLFVCQSCVIEDTLFIVLNIIWCMRKDSLNNTH